MDSPSTKGFHTQLDCKLTYGYKNQTQLTLVQHILFCVLKKKAEQNKNDEKYRQTGITIQIYE